MKKPMTNVQHSSRSDNWGTPTDIIERSRQVLGSIELDPASICVPRRRIECLQAQHIRTLSCTLTGDATRAIVSGEYLRIWARSVCDRTKAVA